MNVTGRSGCLACGLPAALGVLAPAGSALGQVITPQSETRNVLAFEATALLLTLATVGAVVLVRNRGGEDLTVDEPGQAAS